MAQLLRRMGPNFSRLLKTTISARTSRAWKTAPSRGLPSTYVRATFADDAIPSQSESDRERQKNSHAVGIHSDLDTWFFLSRSRKKTPMMPIVKRTAAMNGGIQCTLDGAHCSS